jgi:hypothetical protein
MSTNNSVVGSRANLISLSAIVALLALASCSDAPAGQAVSRSDFERSGRVWPLTVDQGRVGCSKARNGQDAIWFETTAGVRYAIGSWAIAHGGYLDLKPIWAEDVAFNDRTASIFPEEPRGQVRLNIGDLRDEASKLCL